MLLHCLPASQRNGREGEGTEVGTEGRRNEVGSTVDRKSGQLKIMTQILGEISGAWAVFLC